MLKKLQNWAFGYPDNRHWLYAVDDTEDSPGVPESGIQQEVKLYHVIKTKFQGVKLHSFGGELVVSDRSLTIRSIVKGTLTKTWSEVNMNELTNIKNSIMFGGYAQAGEKVEGYKIGTLWEMTFTVTKGEKYVRIIPETFRFEENSISFGFEFYEMKQLPTEVG